MKSLHELSAALRLVREGRLGDAFAQIRELASGGTPPSGDGEAGREAPPHHGSDAAAQPGIFARFPPDGWTRLQPRFPGAFRLPDGGFAPAPAGLRPAAPSEGGLFAEHVYAGQQGRLAYKLYVPSGYRGQPVPLVVMLHGCTQSPDDFAAGTAMNRLAEEQTLLVAYPAQSQAANASKCWNWFRSSDQTRDAGEPALIAGATRQIAGTYAVDMRRISIAGLSAGGAAAAVMGATYPELFAAVGVHSGLACGAARDMASALNAMRLGGAASVRPMPAPPGRPVRTIVFHGDLDTTVNPVNSDQVVAQFQGMARPLSSTVVQGRSTGGLDYTRTVHFDAAGVPTLEKWIVHGAGHAWSGGSALGSFTEPRGPDASREMLRFFLAA